MYVLFYYSGSNCYNILDTTTGDSTGLLPLLHVFSAPLTHNNTPVKDPIHFANKYSCSVVAIFNSYDEYRNEYPEYFI